MKKNYPHLLEEKDSRGRTPLKIAKQKTYGGVQTLENLGFPTQGEIDFLSFYDWLE